MKKLVINGIVFDPDYSNFEWKVTTAVGIVYAQKIISAAYEWCETNHKDECYVKVTESLIWGKKWKITGGK